MYEAEYYREDAIYIQMKLNRKVSYLSVHVYTK